MDDDQHFSTTLLTCLSTFQKCETVAISVSQKLSNSESIDFNDLLGKWIDSRFQKKLRPADSLFASKKDEFNKQRMSRKIPKYAKYRLYVRDI